ncbi:hypothetical protein [Acrocarpospora sp. B8E8]|uniref:hypothetical protein n=1 Tax=Acrocarpospora sp. B8E8 TaxID=3153572 RepID=UPI00325D378C
MAFYKITAPDRKYTGEVGGIGFYKGVAECVDGGTHSAGLNYCRRKGYTVEALDGPAADQEPQDSGDGRPAKSAAKTAWVKYAVARGVPAEEAEKSTRDQLAERFASEGDDQ